MKNKTQREKLYFYFFLKTHLVCFHTNKPLHALSRALVSLSFKKNKLYLSNLKKDYSS